MKHGRILISLVVAVATLTGCTSWRTSIVSGYYDPGKLIQHDYGLDPVLESGVANSCLERDSDVSGRHDLCRVLDGDEEDVKGDTRNFVIDCDGAYPPFGSCPQAVNGWTDGWHGLGFSIVMPDGNTYEGCNALWDQNMWFCDFRARKQVILETSTNYVRYILRAFWNWSRYVVSVAGCAGGIVSVWGGAKVTAVLLNDCADGPYQGTQTASAVGSEDPDAAASAPGGTKTVVKSDTPGVRLSPSMPNPSLTTQTTISPPTH